MRALIITLAGDNDNDGPTRYIKETQIISVVVSWLAWLGWLPRPLSLALPRKSSVVNGGWTNITSRREGNRCNAG